MSPGSVEIIVLEKLELPPREMPVMAKAATSSAGEPKPLAKMMYATAIQTEVVSIDLLLPR